MNRRNFLRNTGAIGLPLLGGIGGIRAASSSRLNELLVNASPDKVLVLVQLNGGNDGLNTLIPVDQLSVLNQVRPNVVLPERSLLRLKPGAAQAFHPRMTGIRNLYAEGKLSIVQSVGYPNQNRSHFRSTDIWSTASPADVEYTTGWFGRHLEVTHGEYPVGYPNDTYPDPLAITMGNNASETCQGTVTNFSQTVKNPEATSDLVTGGATPLPANRYGEEVDFLRVAIIQTDEYGQKIREAALNGSNETDYPDSNLGEQLRNVARLIHGGLQTKIYVVQLGGFDTHAGQVEGDTTNGRHADLVGTLSEALTAFQQDIDALGLGERVLGMTFSEFGRRIRSNSSQGTDHGDAAPLFVFGNCASGSLLGDNPTIDPQVEQGDAVPMQYDFRDIYGSIMMDWFEVDESEVKRLLYPNFNYLPVASACGSSVSLPVDLLSIAARGEDRSIQLEWQTADERSNRGFEIERSTDGRTFSYLAFQPGTAAEGEGASYHYPDHQVREGLLYYYRLRQLDHDVAASVSTIVTARLNGTAIAALTVGMPYPNPVVDRATLQIYAPTDSRVVYTLFDLNGRRLLSDSQLLTGRRDNLVEIRTGRLPAGLYNLRLEVDGQQHTRRITVR